MGVAANTGYVELLTSQRSSKGSLSQPVESKKPELLSRVHKLTMRPFVFELQFPSYKKKLEGLFLSADVGVWDPLYQSSVGMKLIFHVPEQTLGP